MSVAGWPIDLWRQWSLSVESASGGTWMPGESVGTLVHVDPASPSGIDALGWAHVSYDDERVITPYGTASGNDAKTVLRVGDVLSAAHRWVQGPGAVKQSSMATARAARATTVANKALITDRARSLEAHLEGVGIVAVCWDGNTTEHRAEVRANLPSGGALTIVLYAAGDVYVQDAAGSARALEILAAAVDDWETVTAAPGAS